jgi:quercetin dioxygenase-like cupin family protein
MSRNQILKIASWFLAFVLTAGLGIAKAQQSAPTENKGVDIKLVQANNLGPQIEGMAGRQLRMRELTVAPGGFLGVHNHIDRPGVVYILKGTITEHRGNVAKDYSAGDSWLETKETTHWIENKGTTPVEILAVDVFKE